MLYSRTPCARSVASSSAQIGWCRRAYSASQPGWTDIRNALRIREYSMCRARAGAATRPASRIADRTPRARPAGARERAPARSLLNVGLDAVDLFAHQALG